MSFDVLIPPSTVSFQSPVLLSNFCNNASERMHYSPKILYHMKSTTSLSFSSMLLSSSYLLQNRTQWNRVISHPFISLYGNNMNSSQVKHLSSTHWNSRQSNSTEWLDWLWKGAWWWYRFILFVFLCEVVWNEMSDVDAIFSSYTGCGSIVVWLHYIFHIFNFSTWVWFFSVENYYDGDGLICVSNLCIHIHIICMQMQHILFSRNNK